MSFLTEKWTQFCTRTEGSATVEVVLWTPVMAALFGLVIDTGLVMGGRSQVLRVVQDANRAVSIGHIRTELAAEEMILNNIASFAPNALVETKVVHGLISSTVTIPVTDLTATGLVNAFSGFTVQVSAQHLAEN